MAERTIVAGGLQNVAVNLTKADIAAYTKTGQDLVMRLTDGNTVRISGFYNLTPDAKPHLVQLADGALIDPRPDGTVSSAGAAGEEGGLVALGVAGLGAALVAAGGGGGGTPVGTPGDGDEDPPPGGGDDEDPPGGGGGDDDDDNPPGGGGGDDDDD
ncbi:BapA prefix-like domain-containing protein, partial [Falsigemmobacter intermedius]|uniref:BapA prefix-like domain-containing protein n=1 Tax=Falsigemmobacter intermedius TaxID=1553448 RepID=UPI003F108050